MQFFKTGVMIGAATAAVAEAGPPWETRDDIPSGCIPMMKIPDGGRCLFDDQCANGFCCPFYRSCIGPNPGYLRYEDVEVDPVRHAMMWGEGGDVATYDGTQNHVLDGATDTCDRDRQAQQMGLCGAFVMNDEFTVALEDSGSFITAFNLNDADCACDARFKTLYNDNEWTGAFIDGEFRNYCSLDGWDYVLSDKAADRCPPGRLLITNVDECQAAIAYLGLGDSTSYQGGSFGADAFPGCTLNANNGQVAFNGDNTAQVFQLSDIEQFVCKRSGIIITPVDPEEQTGDASSLPSTSSSSFPETSSSSWREWDSDVKCTRVENTVIADLESRGYTPLVCN